jgi:acyl dehydratase
MRVFKNFDEVKAAIGSEIGVSDWVEVTQERINRFAEATGDEQWIHVDVKRAKRSCRERRRSPTAC